ncbi:hypothetical protein ACQR09_12575 [Bradyrhizobium oligotrophicum]|uniref:hypothetical protein n=1 Tax=Bradyrhizobium oligotrophicum TaxID=44255 RepID=UPI003EB96B18
MDAVSQLRASLLPILQTLEQELQADNPGVATHIHDWPVGERTDWKGHDIGIECLFEGVALDQPDHLVLSVSLKHVDTAPAIVSADIVWGAPSGSIEASILSECVEFSPDRLAELIKGLPDLLDALKHAIRRGHPRS